MENLDIKGTKGTFFTPSVSFNATTGVCEISGESYLEDTWEFYTPLINWLEQYIIEVRGPIYFTFSLTYFNTSSSKCLLDIAKILKKYQDQGNITEVTWVYPEDDDDLREEGEDYKNYLGLNLEIVCR